MGGSIAHDLHVCPVRRFGDPASEHVWVANMSEEQARSVFQCTSVSETLLMVGTTHPGLSWFFMTYHWSENFVGDYRCFGYVDCDQNIDVDPPDDDE